MFTRHSFLKEFNQKLLEFSLPIIFKLNNPQLKAQKTFYYNFKTQTNYKLFTKLKEDSKSLRFSFIKLLRKKSSNQPTVATQTLFLISCDWSLRSRLMLQLSITSIFLL